jgi:hypothetical protein
VCVGISSPAKRSFENVSHFKYLGLTATNQNLIQEKIKRRLDSGNIPVTPIRIFETIILPVFLYGCETWSLTLREEQRLKGFENRVLRRIFGPKRDEVRGENSITRSFMICTLRQA